MAVVVNQLNDGSNLGASYEGVSVAAGFKTVVLPYVVRGDGNCYYSNFTVRNMGTIAAGLTIRYYNGGGSLLTTSTDTVMSHRVYNLYTATPAGQSFPTIPFVGSVVISSTQPIAASSNLLNYCGGSDTISFTGIDR